VKLSVDYAARDAEINGIIHVLNVGGCIHAALMKIKGICAHHGAHLEGKRNLDIFFASEVF